MIVTFTGGKYIALHCQSHVSYWHPAQWPELDLIIKVMGVTDMAGGLSVPYPYFGTII